MRLLRRINHTLEFWAPGVHSAIALAILALVSTTSTALSDGVQVPVLLSSKERLSTPDLSAMIRLRFLTTTDFPPFNYLDAEGRLSGFHVDLSRAICAELLLTDRCEIQALPWNELETALSRGDGEAIIAGLEITAQNRAKLGFSRPYLRFPGRFAVLMASGSAEPIAKTLQGERIGVVAGSAHEQLLRDEFPGIEAVPYQRQEDMLAGLKAAKIDAVFADGMRLAFWLASEDAAGCCRFAGGPYLAPEYFGGGLAIAVAPNDKNLVAAFDTALQQITVKGTFAELYLRYFPVGFY